MPKGQDNIKFCAFLSTSGLTACSQETKTEHAGREAEHAGHKRCVMSCADMAGDVAGVHMDMQPRSMQISSAPPQMPSHWTHSDRQSAPNNTADFTFARSASPRGMSSTPAIHGKPHRCLHSGNEIEPAIIVWQVLLISTGRTWSLQLWEGLQWCAICSEWAQRCCLG